VHQRIPPVSQKSFKAVGADQIGCKDEGGLASSNDILEILITSLVFVFSRLGITFNRGEANFINSSFEGVTFRELS